MSACIFDMDGVLVDSEPHHHAAWHRICLEEGAILTLAQVAERTLGRPVRESLPTLLGRPLDPDEIERLTRRKAAFYEEASGGRVREVHGAAAFVRSLTTLGVPCALATSALPYRVVPVLDTVELYRFGGQPVLLYRLLLCLTVTAFICYLNYRGIRSSATFQNVCTFGLLAVFAVFSALGFVRGDVSNLTPLFSHPGAAGALVVEELAECLRHDGPHWRRPW
jgi:hypothetical protein